MMKKKIILLNFFFNIIFITALYLVVNINDIDQMLYSENFRSGFA